MRPNPPRLVTIALAVLLLVIGLVLIYAQGSAADLIQQLPLGGDMTRQLLDLIAQKTVAYLCLAASPILLIIGSLVKGI